ncbi:DUF6978 family protein [Massilioclostridium coli]|uniref:DUF6978 family protein n=1 Tax=Massilioclostridium coli TaxID=1870991 RepID=UPI0022E4B5AC|nr:hypothetical protein [Massilioclostridium coli]
MTDSEFKSLMKLKKKFSEDSICLPKQGESCMFHVESLSTRDKFYVDTDRSSKIELKIKIQNRYALTKQPLVRIDINSPFHRNPDGTRISRNHIHIFKETDNMTGNLPWAYELETFDANLFKIQTLDFTQIFYDFCDFCNIEINNIQGVI